MRKDRLEPERYWPSSSDPNYQEDLLSYLDAQDIRHLQQHMDWNNPPEVKLRKEYDRIPGYVKEITASLNQGFGGLPSEGLPSEQAITSAIQAMKTFGIRVLFPPRWKRLAPRSRLSLRVHKEGLRRQWRRKRLAEAIIKLIENLQTLIYGGRHSAKARKQLERVLKSIIPETRGKGMTVHPMIIRSCYYKELYRLYHIRHFFKQPGLRRGEKVKEASRRFDMPVKTIRELWSLDEDNQPTRPISLREMARSLVARRFRISPQTVSNKLSV